jgi:PAS domain S-box-containing protein
MKSTELLELLPVPVYTTDAEGRITFYNEAAAELWGHRPDMEVSRWCGSWRLYWPDGQPVPHDAHPMALALNKGRPVRGIEAIAERPDGTRVRFLTHPTPLRDDAGKLIGGINLLMDVTRREEDAIDLARLAAIVASSDDAIVSKTLEGIITSWNEGATRIFGYEASEMIGRAITTFIPPELHAEERQILARLRRGERIQHYETVRVAKDGRRVDISLTVSPLRDKTGRVIGASKVGRDITERKRSEKLQQMLIEELNHRVNNTLATVQAIASQSVAHARTPGDFIAGFTGRLEALANTHTLLVRSEMRGAEIIDLVRGQVLLGDGVDDRISYSGPLLVLEAQSALHLALILHELATNARKHGALSAANGRLSIGWELHTNGGHNLLLRWQESGGPTVRAPVTRGFGASLIEHTLRAHGGDVSIQFRPDGMSCQIRMPLPDEARPAMSARIGPPTRTSESLVLQPQEDRHNFSGKRILIVEDEPLVAMELESNLTAAGFEVVGPAGTVEQAKLLIVQQDFNAALIDVNLAGRVVDEIAAALSQKSCPFAFVTGYGREALPNGFQDTVLLGKPFTGTQVLAAVEQLLYRGAEIVPLRQRKL